MKKLIAINLSFLAFLALASAVGLRSSEAKRAPIIDESILVGALDVVRGTVLSSVCRDDESNQRVFTYTKLRVEEVFKGPISEDEIVLKEEGGESGRLGERVSGTPTFNVGEHVIVSLDTWPDGSLRVYQMFLGKLSIKRDRESGDEVVVPDTADSDGAMLTAAGREKFASFTGSDAAHYLTALRRSVIS